MSTKMQDSWIY